MAGRAPAEAFAVALTCCHAGLDLASPALGLGPLKELETLERISERIDKISVFGGLDQVLNGLVTLAPR